MEDGIGYVVGGLLCGGLTCIGLAIAILVAVVVFWNRNQTVAAPEPARPAPLPPSMQRTVIQDLPPEPVVEPDLFDEDEMSTVVSPPSGRLPSEPPPPAPPTPTAPEDAPPPPSRRRDAGPTIITFDEDDD